MSLILARYDSIVFGFRPSEVRPSLAYTAQIERYGYYTYVQIEASVRLFFVADRAARRGTARVYVHIIITRSRSYSYSYLLYLHAGTSKYVHTYTYTYTYKYEYEYEYVTIRIDYEYFRDSARNRNRTRFGFRPSVLGRRATTSLAGRAFLDSFFAARLG